MKHGCEIRRSVFDAFTSEVNKHPDFHTGGFQLVQKLRLVWSVIALGHFDLDDYAAINEEICIILAHHCTFM